MLFIGAAIAAGVAARTFASPDKFANVLALSLIAVVGLFLVINYLLWETPIYMLEAEEYVTRQRFTLGYAPPLAVADLLAITLICLFASDFNKLIKVILFCPFIALLWMTNGRGALAALVIALLAMIFFRIKHLGVRILLGMGMLFSLAYLFVAIFNLMNVATKLWGEDAQSLNGRTGLWSYTIPLILQKPLLGYGYYSSRFVLINEFYWAGHSHNSFLEVALSTGLVGLALVAVFTIYFFYSLVKTGDQLLLGLGLFCYISGMLSTLLFTPGIPMFILLASLLYASRVRERVRSPYTVSVAHSRLRNEFDGRLSARYGPR
jgi:O-antigen ligase